MNELNELTLKDTPLPRKAKCCLSNYSLGADYDVSLKLFSADCPATPECSHHFKGNSRHSLCKLLTLGGIIAASAAALLCITHLFCSWVCRVR